MMMCITARANRFVVERDPWKAEVDLVPRLQTLMDIPSHDRTARFPVQIDRIAVRERRRVPQSSR
jgi:hypothetical protein